MSYRNHTTRCRHGFCVDTVGCETCAIKPDAFAAGHYLRKLHTPLRDSGASSDRNVPASYRYQGRHGSTGNTNAKRKYEAGKWG